MNKALLFTTGLVLSFSAFSAAGAVHDHTHHPAVVKTATNPAVSEYTAAMNRMHENMMVPYSGDADIDFVRGMIPHHQGAVDMAETELKYGKDETLRALAGRIIAAQKLEIGFMKNWLSGHDNGYNYADAEQASSTVEYKKVMEDMHHGMMIDYSGDADVDFARGMIPHHQGAVDMAYILRKYGKQEELRPMLDDVIRSQQQEIALMKEWLKDKK